MATPPAHMRALAKLAGDAPARDRLVESLLGLETMKDMDVLPELVAQATSFPKDEAESIASAIVRGFLEMDAKTLSAPDMASKMLANLDAGRLGGNEGVSGLVEMFAAILGKAGNIGLGIKAYALRVEVEREIVSARIITDVRPVFLGESLEPKLLIPIHTLHLSTAATPKNQEFFFTLGQEDLELLTKQFDRALKKEASLRKNLEGVPFWG